MIGICPHCKGPMKPLFGATWFCPKDCDRKPKDTAVFRGGGYMIDAVISVDRSLPAVSAPVITGTGQIVPPAIGTSQLTKIWGYSQSLLFVCHRGKTWKAKEFKGPGLLDMRGARGILNGHNLRAWFVMDNSIPITDPRRGPPNDPWDVMSSLTPGPGWPISMDETRRLRATESIWTFQPYP